MKNEYLHVAIEFAVKFVAMNVSKRDHRRNLSIDHCAFQIDKVARPLKGLRSQDINLDADSMLDDKHLFMQVTGNEHIRLWGIHHHLQVFSVKGRNDQGTFVADSLYFNKY